MLESLRLSSLFKSRHKWCKETDQKRERTGYAALKIVQENIRVILSIVIWRHSLLHSTVYSLEGVHMGEQIGQCYNLKLFAIQSARYNWKHNSLQGLTKRCLLLVCALANCQDVAVSSSLPLLPAPEVGTQLSRKAYAKLKKSHMKRPWGYLICLLSSARSHLLYYLIYYSRPFYFSFLSLSAPPIEDIKSFYPHRTKFKLYVQTTINVNYIRLIIWKTARLRGILHRGDHKERFRFELDLKTCNLYLKTDEFASRFNGEKTF